MQSMVIDRLRAAPQGLPAKLDCSTRARCCRDALLCVTPTTDRHDAYGLCGGTTLGDCFAGTRFVRPVELRHQRFSTKNTFDESLRFNMMRHPATRISPRHRENDAGSLEIQAACDARRCAGDEDAPTLSTARVVDASAADVGGWRCSQVRFECAALLLFVGAPPLTVRCLH